MKFSILSFFLLLFGFGFHSSETENVHSTSLEDVDAKINWLTWEEALKKNEKEPRKILVDVYTNWCGWCKKMDKATFQKGHIADYVNEKYYAVKFNAEMKDGIDFNGKTYKFVKNGMRGYHELAAEITRGNLSFPTVVFLNENLEVIQPIPGYKAADEFEMIMTYFGENEHTKTPWTVYQKNYRPLKP